MDLFRMKCFITVAEAGNITKAAELMNITQPAMSFQIRELEKEVQMTLLNRSKTGISLTPAGEVMKEGFANLLKSYDKYLEKARAKQSKAERLVIGYHGSLEWAGLNELVAAFSEEHPEVQVAVLQQHWKELADYLEMGAIDIAFLEESELTGRKDLEGIPYFTDHACFAVSPHHHLADKEFLTIDDIRGETILMNNHASESQKSMIRMMKASGIEEEQIMFFDAMEVTLSMAAARQGIASIPKSFRSTANVLKYIDYEAENFKIPVVLSKRKDDKNTAVAQFCEFIRDVPDTLR